MARLTDLPFELLVDLLVRSGNEDLVVVSRWTYWCLRPALTPRTCYRIVRERGEWLKGRVISNALSCRFLSPALLEQIERNMHELVPAYHQESGKEKGRRKIRDVRIDKIKIPNRLFQFAQNHPMPAVSTSRTKSTRGTKRKRIDENPNQTRYDIVRKLLKLDLSVQGARGSTALVMAARAGNLSMVRLLLRHGADTVSGGSDSKALLMAVVYGHLDVVKRLVRAGAAVSSLALRYA
ncbi:hypothetical protein EV175_006293, partial [Coemansia sp. RSA 1933]